MFFIYFSLSICCSVGGSLFVGKESVKDSRSKSGNKNQLITNIEQTGERKINLLMDVFSWPVKVVSS